MSTPHDPIRAAQPRRHPRVPVLPPGLSRLMVLLSDERLGTRGLATNLAHFPTIAAQLVALANSAWVAPRAAVTSLVDACALLGLTVVRSVSLALAVAHPFNASRCPSFDARRFWCVALLTAEGAPLLAPALERRGEALDEGSLRTTGVLHQLGLLWMADGWPLQAGAAFDLAARGAPAGLMAAQRATCGTDYGELGGALARAWRLPAPLAVAMAHHRDVDYRGPHGTLAAGIGAVAAMAGRSWRGGAPVGPQPERAPRPSDLAPDLVEEVEARIAGRRDSVLALADTLFAT